MQKATFLDLCAELAPALQCRDTRMRGAPRVEKSVVIILWKLAIPDCYCSVRNRFGVGKSTVEAIVVQVCGAMQDYDSWQCARNSGWI